MKTKHLFLLLVCLLVLAGGGYYAKITLFPSEATKQVLTARAEVEDIEETVLASGTLEAFKLVSVGAQVSGQVKALHVKLGEKVTQGQLVAEIDSLTQQNNLLNAEAALQNIKSQKLAKEAALKQAELIYKRQQKLRTHDAISEESFQTAEANLTSARADIAALSAQITQAEISVDIAKVNLNYTKITAPIDGTVVAVVTEEGQTVNAAQQAPTIIKLAQLDKMTIKAQISEADITRVALGQKVYFTILGEPDHRYFATLRAIEPAPDSISTDSTSSSSSTTSTTTAIYYNGLFDAENPDGKLRISMTAEINIVLNEAKSAVVIPRSALGNPNSDGTYTLQIISNPTRTSSPRTVKIGINNNVKVQVIEGLKEGEEIVIGETTATDTTSSTSSRRGPPHMGF